MTNANALPPSSAVPAVGAVRKSADVWHSTVVSPNSDDKRSDSPFPATETRTAYRVKRSDNTDTATGQPFCELWSGSDRLAHFVPVAPGSVGAMQTIQKSMYKPWGAMAHGEAIDLHPAIVITLPRGAMGRSDVSVSVRQAAFKDDIERDTDKRKRGLYACECLAATLHVTDWTMIARQHITAAAEMDLDAALAAIRAKAETTDTSVHPNIEGALAVVEDFKGKVIAVDATKEMKEKLDETFGEKHFSADGAWRMAVADERKKYRVSAALTSKEFEDWLHKIFDVKSLKELSMTPQAALGIIADTLKQEFGAKPKPVDNAETSAVDAASVPVAPTEAAPVPPTPNGATAAHAEPADVPSVAFPNYPESPIVVFPMQNGSHVYKGIRFSVTYRLGGTWTMAVALMEEFAAHREFIDPSCIVNAAPMQNAQTGGSTAPAPAPVSSASPAPAPAPNGAPAGDGGSYVIREIKKVADEGKTTYHLFDVPGAEKSVLRTQMTDVFTGLIAFDQMEVGKRYQVSWNVTWKPSKNVGKNGSPFKNIAKINAA